MVFSQPGAKNFKMHRAKVDKNENIFTLSAFMENSSFRIY